MFAVLSSRCIPRGTSLLIKPFLYWIIVVVRMDSSETWIKLDHPIFCVTKFCSPSFLEKDTRRSTCNCIICRYFTSDCYLWRRWFFKNWCSKLYCIILIKIDHIESWWIREGWRWNSSFKDFDSTQYWRSTD